MQSPISENDPFLAVIYDQMARFNAQGCSTVTVSGGHLASMTMLQLSIDHGPHMPAASLRLSYWQRECDGVSYLLIVTTNLTDGSQDRGAIPVAQMETFALSIACLLYSYKLTPSFDVSEIDYALTAPMGETIH